MSHRSRSLSRFAVALALAGVFAGVRASVQMFAAPVATFATLPNLNFNQGQTVTVAFAALGFPDGVTYTAQGLPSGLTLSMGVDTLGHQVGILNGTLTPDTPTTSGSEGIYNVRILASDGAVSNFFTVDVSHWNHGDVFVGAGGWNYSVYREDGTFKTNLLVPDDPNSTDGYTTGCAVNWRTGEVWATNFDYYSPALNVITRHAGSNPLPYTDPLRRLSTERYGSGNVLNPFAGNIYPFDTNPESVAFDNAGNMYVGHSFGYWNDNGDVADKDGTAIVLHNPDDEGWIYVDAMGQPILDGTGTKLFDNTPISPAGFFEKWVTGGFPINILSLTGQPILAPVQGGMDLHRYTPDENGNYNQATRQFFDLHYGQTGVDAIDLQSDQKSFVYSSEDWYMHRYDVAADKQLPVVGSSVVGESRPVIKGAVYGVRVLPPGDGTGGYLAAKEDQIVRFDQNGRIVQYYDVQGDPDYSNVDYPAGDVTGWFSLAIAPDGRTFWAATRQDVFRFDIASGDVIGTKIHATVGTLHTNQELAGLCVMAEYRAAQEVCGVNGNGNGIDDDTDGTIDEGCFRLEVCSTLSPGDDDGDGLVDYNDPDCGAEPSQQCVTGGPTDNSVAGFCDRSDFEGDNVAVPGIPPCPNCVGWTYSYSAVGLPAGLTMNAATGAVSGMPMFSIVNPNSELSAPVIYPVRVTSTVTPSGQPSFSFTDDFNWTIYNRNRAPEAFDDGPQTVIAGASFDFDVRSNDTDVDGDTFTVLSFTQPPSGQGTVALVGNNLLYTAPAVGFVGPTSFTYKLQDSYETPAVSNDATVRITIKVNEVPVAVNDVFTTDEDLPVSSTLKTNDTPSGDGGNVWSKVTSPANGTASVNADGTFTYTPNPNFNGTDSFAYKVCDLNGDCSTATVTITITPVDEVPVAVNDSYTTPANTPVAGTAQSNDTPSPDGGNVWAMVSAPTSGTLVFNSTGTFTYTPVAGFVGTVTFTYQVCDVDGDCSTATVTIIVTPVATTPVSTGDTATIGYWQNKNGQALILKLNGSSSATGLGNWLATSFPAMWGALAGTANNMTGKTNTQVAAYYKTVFASDKWVAQVLGGAIASYVTNSTLAGGNYSVPYGFNCSSTGTGARTWNTGRNGTKIGLANNTSYTVTQLLAQANLRKQQGLYNSNAFNVIFTGINEAGDIK